MIGYEFEHQLNDTITLRQNARYATIKQKYRYTGVCQQCGKQHSINA